MSIHCKYCGSNNIRPSLFQSSDWIHLLLLRHPIRCRSCRERSYVSIFRIAEIRRKAVARTEHEIFVEDAGKAAFVDSPPREDYDRA